MRIKELTIVAMAAALGFPATSFSQSVLQQVTATARAIDGEQQQQVDQLDSLYGPLAASASESSTVVTTYFNGQPIYATATSSASMQVALAPGSLSVDANGHSGGITAVGTLSASASALLELDVTSPSPWTLTLTDNTTNYGEYNVSILNSAGQSVWYDSKSRPDPEHSETVSLALAPGLYQFALNFNAVNLTDTGADAGSLSLTMTSPVPLPASVWTLGSAAALLWVLVSRRRLT